MRQMIPTSEKMKIVDYLEHDHKTLQEVGDIFGVTRERIRQLYKKITGKKVGPIHKRWTKTKKKLKIAARSFVCTNCHKFVDKLKKENRHRMRNLCNSCRFQMKKENRDLKITLNCEWCGSEFHPYRSAKGEAKFCKQICYFNLHRNKELQ